MIGRNVFEHHDENSRKQMKSVVNQRKHVIYTTEKGGIEKAGFDCSLVPGGGVRRFRTDRSGYT